MRATINRFASSDTLIVCKPFPLQFAGNVTPENEHAFQRALSKLRKHWVRVGFRKIPRSVLFAMSLTQEPPALDEMLRGLVADRVWLYVWHIAARRYRTAVRASLTTEVGD